MIRRDGRAAGRAVALGGGRGRAFTDRERSRGSILLALCLAALIINIDITIVNVALPSLVRELGATTTNLQWVVDAYSLVFASLILAAGTLSDRLGRKGVLLAGLAVFALGSLAGSLANTPGELIAARAFMGIGAAGISTSWLYFMNRSGFGGFPTTLRARSSRWSRASPPTRRRRYPRWPGWPRVQLGSRQQRNPVPAQQFVTAPTLCISKFHSKPGHPPILLARERGWNPRPRMLPPLVGAPGRSRTRLRRLVRLRQRLRLHLKHRNPPTEVDFAKVGRIPLLFIGLSEDHVVPPKATMHNERKYDDSVSITEYHEFEGRPHFPGAPGWEEVADFAIDWAERHAGLTVAEHAAAKDPVSGG